MLFLSKMDLKGTRREVGYFLLSLMFLSMELNEIVKIPCVLRKTISVSKDMNFLALFINFTHMCQIMCFQRAETYDNLKRFGKRTNECASVIIV